MSLQFFFSFFIFILVQQPHSIQIQQYYYTTQVYKKNPFILKLEYGMKKDIKNFLFVKVLVHYILCCIIVKLCMLEFVFLQEYLMIIFICGFKMHYAILCIQWSIEWHIIYRVALRMYTNFFQEIFIYSQKLFSVVV